MQTLLPLLAVLPQRLMLLHLPLLLQAVLSPKLLLLLLPRLQEVMPLKL